MGGSEILLALIGTGGIGAVAGSVVAGLFGKRKLGAEATEIITKAASGVVERIEQDNAALRSQVALLEKVRVQDRDERRSEMRAWRETLQLHAAWDALAIAKITDSGLTGIPGAPPLYPPHTTNH